MHLNGGASAPVHAIIGFHFCSGRRRHRQCSGASRCRFSLCRGCWACDHVVCTPKVTEETKQSRLGRSQLVVVVLLLLVPQQVANVYCVISFIASALFQRYLVNCASHGEPGKILSKKPKNKDGDFAGGMQSNTQD